MLIDAFPELRQAYDEEVCWQEGDNTGSHVVYGDLFSPEILKLLDAGELESVKRYLAFAEKLLESGDEYADNVVALSVLETIYYDEHYRELVRDYLGPRCLQVFQDFAKTDQEFLEIPYASAAKLDWDTLEKIRAAIDAPSAAA